MRPPIFPADERSRRMGQPEMLSSFRCGSGEELLMKRIASRVAALAVLALALPESAALGQLRTEDVARERTLPLEETVRIEADEAKFRLGPVRLLPRIGLTNLGYNNNVIGATSSQPAVGDWTGTISAGLGYLVPVGGSFYLRGEAVPEYTWFKDLAERRAWGGSLAASVLALPKAFRLEAGGAWNRGTIFYSSEVVTPVVQESQSGRVHLDVPVTSRISVFAVGEVRKTTHPDDSQTIFSATDRREDVVRGGVSFQVAEHLRFSAAAERNRARFETQATFRDNTGTGYFGSVFYDRERFFVNLVLGVRRYEPEDSTFEPFSGTTGGLFVSYFITRRLEAQLVGRRGVSNSVTNQSSYYVETTGGGALSYAIGRKLKVLAFGESGTNEYPLPDVATGTRRQDDLTRYGMAMTYALTPFVSLSGRVTRDELRSNLPGLDRSITYFNMGLNLSGTPKGGKN